MVTSVYALVCEALSGLISRRAAENVVRDAVRSAGTSVDRVTAREMQDLLKGRIFGRLQTIIPVTQARGEVRTLLRQLDAMLAERRPLGPEVLEGLGALRAEFAPYAGADHPVAARIRTGLDSVHESPDAVLALNSLWDELAVLQLELSDPPADPEDRSLDPGALTPAAVTPAAVTLPAAREPDRPAEAARAVPIAVAERPAAARAVRRPAGRMTPEQQELLMTRFALEEGVVGVVLCDRLGGVHNARLNEGSAEMLAGVSAATAMLLDRTRPFGVFYSHLGEASVFIVPLGEDLLTVLAGAHVNVGRVLSEVEALKEEI